MLPIVTAPPRERRRPFIVDPAPELTAVVAIKLMRQEQLPDGSWAEATEVPYLKNNVWPYPLPKNASEVTWFRGWSDSPQGQNDLAKEVEDGRVDPAAQRA